MLFLWSSKSEYLGEKLRYTSQWTINCNKSLDILDFYLRPFFGLLPPDYSISTPEISVVVVIGGLRPRPIPILGRNRFYLSVLEILSLPLEISVVVVIDQFRPQLIPFLGRYRFYFYPEILVMVVIGRLRPRPIQILGRYWLSLPAKYQFELELIWVVNDG